MSWESLEEITSNTKEVKHAQEIASMYFSCFNTEVGRLVLEDLVKKFLTKPIVRPGEDAYAQGVREGRADLIRQLLVQIEFAKNPESTENGVFAYLKNFIWRK